MNLLKSILCIFLLFSFVIKSVFCYEDNCGIYPSCSQYADGAHQILEDCHKYIICETVDGERVQTNTQCERNDQVFADEFGRCVDWEMATECKSFQENAICLAQCPRVMLVSYGPGLTYQERRTGCFRIAGSLFGNTLAFYQNKHMQYLTPDANSNPLKINWLVSEKPGSFNGGIKNSKYDYVRCPFDNWGGWEVDKGLGHWVADETMQVTCYSGDEVAPIPFSTTSTKPTTVEKTTTQALAPSTTTTEGPCKEKKWWETTVVYQIYPRSFQDSDGDGTGDLKGITSRLDHLVDLGVETFWLSPIYESPMADFGYDVSNYTDIDPIFGTMEDFEELTSKAKEKGLKVVMDFVPNHTSRNCTWFIKSEVNDPYYKDWYVWRNASSKFPNVTDCKKTPWECPPNNWLSVFRGSAWEWSEERQQFYYHAFLKEQPDLNYRNPDVLQEMKNILKFWVVDKGVDGFRMDAVPFLYEDEQFRDEPPSNKPDVGPDEWNYLDHIYTLLQPEHYTALKALHDSLDELDGDQLMMVEALNDDFSTDQMMSYYEVSDFPFNFNFIIHLPSPLNGTQIDEQANINWIIPMEKLSKNNTANWVLGNHDNSRVGSRYGEENIDAMNMLAMLLQGVAVTYQGEEIGMTNTNVSWEQTVDPAGLNCGKDHYTDPGCSRDPERTPMQWDETKFAGFCNCTNTTWLPVNENYKDVNVKKQLSDEESHLKVYKKLVELRKTEVIKNGPHYSWGNNPSGDSFSFARYNDNTAYIVAMTITNKNYTFNLKHFLPTGYHHDHATVYTRSIGSTNDQTVPGTAVPDLDQVTLQAHEAVVIEVKYRSGANVITTNFILAALVLLINAIF